MAAPLLELCVPLQELGVPESQGGGHPRNLLPVVRHPSGNRVGCFVGLADFEKREVSL